MIFKQSLFQIQRKFGIFNKDVKYTFEDIAHEMKVAKDKAAENK